MKPVRLASAGAVVITTFVLGLPSADADIPVVKCRGHLATILGTPDHDRIIGTDGPDVIVAKRGGDFIDGGNGDDLICGGYGADRIRGGEGNDRLFGQAEGQFKGDTLDGGPGDDRLVPNDEDAGCGCDVITYELETSGVMVNVDKQIATGPSIGRDRIENVGGVLGSPYADRIIGYVYWVEARGGDDVVRGATWAYGDDGSDRIIGTMNSDQPDVLHGGLGDDVIRGREGLNILYGDDGDDRLVGGPRDKDKGDGGSGTDTCLRIERATSCELDSAGGYRVSR